MGDVSTLICETTMNKHITEYHPEFYQFNQLHNMNTQYYNSGEDEMTFFRNLETVKSITMDNEVCVCFSVYC